MTTSVELPEFKKCCFCCPLRPGLITWGYIKLVLTTTLGLIAFFVVSDLSETYAVIPICVDFVFIIIFIVSAHRKDHNLMKVYYYYSSVMVFLNGAAVILCIVFAIITLTCSVGAVGFLILFVALILIFIINTMAQIYLTLLIRSEILKLKNNLQCKFIKKIVQDDSEMGNAHEEKVKYGRLGADVVAQDTDK